MHPGAEGLHRRGARAGDVEPVGVVVHGGVAVGCAGVHLHESSCGDEHSGKFDVLTGHPQRADHDGRVPHGLFDGAVGQVGMCTQQGPLVGMLAQHLYRGGDLVAGGVGAGRQQAGREHSQFVGTEPVTVLLGADEVREEIVGEVVAATGDHVIDVVVEGLPGGQDRGLVFGDVPVEGVHEVVDPDRQLLPVLGRGAEQRADDRGRVLPRDVGHDVAVATCDLAVDQIADDVDDGGAQAFDGAAAECCGNQSTQAGVLGAVDADDRRADPVPHRA